MLKETETEETIVFFVTFLSLVAFQLGLGPDPLGTILAMPMNRPLQYGFKRRLKPFLKH